MKFSKQADYIGWVTATLSKYIKISIETSSNSFLQRILKKTKKGTETSFQTTFFIEFFGQNFSFHDINYTG